MKTMVKNGDLLDVEPDGTITVAGKPIGGGGSDYTAGSNIEISQEKEIAVKSTLTGIESVKFANNYACRLESNVYGDLLVKTTSPYHDFSFIRLFKTNSTEASVDIYCQSNYQHNQNLRFVVNDYNGSDAFCVFTRGGVVPQVPKEAGTYILKATVSGNNVTYEWVAG